MQFSVWYVHEPFAICQGGRGGGGYGGGHHGGGRGGGGRGGPPPGGAVGQSASVWRDILDSVSNPIPRLAANSYCSYELEEFLSNRENAVVISLELLNIVAFPRQSPFAYVQFAA